MTRTIAKLWGELFEISESRDANSGALEEDEILLIEEIIAGVKAQLLGREALQVTMIVRGLREALTERWRREARVQHIGTTVQDLYQRELIDIELSADDEAETAEVASDALVEGRITEAEAMELVEDTEAPSVSAAHLRRVAHRAGIAGAMELGAGNGHKELPVHSAVEAFTSNGGAFTHWTQLPEIVDGAGRPGQVRGMRARQGIQDAHVVAYSRRYTLRAEELWRRYQAEEA